MVSLRYEFLYLSPAKKKNKQKESRAKKQQAVVFSPSSSLIAFATAVIAVSSIRDITVVVVYSNGLNC